MREPEEMELEMDSMKRWGLIMAAASLVLSLAGCGSQLESPPATETVNVTEALTEPVETTVETQAETVAETEPVEITEPPVAEEPEPVAEYIDTGVRITLDGTDIAWQLDEAEGYEPVGIPSSQALAVESETPFSALYIIWDKLPGRFTLTWEGGSLVCGEEGFLHDYIRLPEAVVSVSFEFEEEAYRYICRMGAYTYGTAPDGVQDWLAPCETADILAFPTHADDDVLFFGAVLSHYAIEKGLAVQTAFMTDHYYEPFRNHERLNGLWELGIRHYPILGTARDFYTMDLTEAANYHANDGILEWQVELIRRFDPLVILGHDIDGEYGHGQHKLNTHYLIQAVEQAADARLYPMIAVKYGLWDTPKVYLHLYAENGVVFDVNTALNNDPQGRTPFEIAQDAFECHVSQYNYFSVSQNPYSEMDCTRFGLYRTLVGEDTGSDLMEHAARGE